MKSTSSARLLCLLLSLALCLLCCSLAVAVDSKSLASPAPAAAASASSDWTSLPPIVLLQDGQGQAAQAQQGSSLYFAFYLPSTALTNAFILVNATAISGDPDLYASRDCGGYPSPQCCSWKANEMGSNALLISQAEPGLYYVAVHAFSTTQFIVTASSVDAALDSSNS